MKKIIARLFGKNKSKIQTFNATATLPSPQYDGIESDVILFHHWQRPGEVRVITLRG